MMKPPPISQKYFSRRALLRGMATLPLLGVAAALPGCRSLDDSAPPAPVGPGLGELAKRQNRQYGVATQSWILAHADFAEALRREANLLVTENELKWYAIRPSPDEFNFTGYRKLAAFARANDMAMRGHTLVWYQGNPKWLAPMLADADAATAEKILTTHINGVIGETSPFIKNWDVVNEAIDWDSSREDGLRDSLWLKALGPDYLALAFNLAHKADPNLTLAYNDYGTEQGDGAGRRKRQCILRMLEKCVKDKVPVHALGLQSHLQAHMPLADSEFVDFLKEARALGLKIYITELDLDVSKLYGRMDDRIRLAQNYLRSYLDLVQQGGAVDMLLTWGLSDRYSWLLKEHPNLKGILPLDANLNRGPMWETLKRDWLKVSN
jgi:endo-1,4-beta-xylanase